MLVQELRAALEKALEEPETEPLGGTEVEGPKVRHPELHVFFSLILVFFLEFFFFFK